MRVVVALSGGSDSVAMLVLLRELAASGEMVLAGAAHLNHRLRVSAARDEAFCRALCARFEVPLIVESADVGRESAAARTSIEAMARRLRYAFLERARVLFGADCVAVAHTIDDQAETVLLRLLRGAGPRGLRGVLPARGTVVRPLLDCARHELREALAARGETWVDDETNDDVTMLRNRVRHELLPLLATRFQPAVNRVLARTADVASAEDALLENLAAEIVRRVVRARPAWIEVDAAALRDAPLALQRRVARAALVAAGPWRAPDLADVDRVLAVCGEAGPRAAEAAGVRVERFPPGTVLLSKDARPLASEPLPERSLTVPGVVDLPEIGRGCRICAHWPIQERTAGATGVPRVALTKDVAVPLVVRSRRPGDRLRPVGLGGTKTLQDLFVDRKVPVRERDRVPVVTDATGRIVWVAGHAADAGAVAASGEDDVIVLTFEQPGPPGSEGS